jgi:taurine dioxygenase
MQCLIARLSERSRRGCLENEMLFDSIKLKPLSPNVGAHVTGADLSQPLSPAQVADITSALAHYGVLQFREQPLNQEKLVRLGRQFGRLHLHTGVKRDPACPEITAIYADENTKHANGEVWHSDLSCDQFPPLGSILHMKIVPETGGDTGFASMYAAYDALSNRMKTYLEGLSATHDGHATFSRYNPGGSYPRAVHPVINTHPVSGRKGIYVNRGFTIHINELPDDEGDALLAFLFDHCESPNWSTRFHWQEDTVAFWDNRCVQHLAIFDYFPQKRSGFRVQIASDAPIQ